MKMYHKYGGKRLLTVLDEQNNVWYKGSDVAEILHFKRPTQAIRKNVNKEDQQSLKTLNIPKNMNLKEFHKSTKFINKRGLTSLLVKHRTVSSEKVVDQIRNDFQLNIDLPKRTKEQRCIGEIIERFPNENIELQFYVKPYRIDMYFKKHRIAVECDENGHKYRNKEKEIQRQKFIETKLKCVFIRFNPDDENFDIKDVICNIETAIHQKYLD